MKYVVPRGDANFEPKDPLWEEKVRESFERQGAMHLLGATISDVWPGGCEIRLPFRQDLTQQHGFFHAGITATAMDSAAGYAGFSLMPHNTSVLSVEFKLNLLAPADGELLVAVGEVIKPGKNLIVTRGDAWVFKGAKRTHCAMMQQTLMTMHGKAEKT
ncbi:MAG: PaaI family thioesterase [Rhodocyclaceae bacterium]|nr:PaaI family thioesterase [Rhodocyclaceae bacterium]MBK6554444.1 PaaI family thioesterase [Rhodocyclaceae bacterium]MBK6677601.1 PaaI family thioesterase [Rhodocyclaceae bacterium]MBK7812980.1 PaaI family thioesterase [Rhodocyclaceae bacterium]MBK9310276.1 PaaI family thioesterase [Rhodocyclaceae bacterium]